MIKGFVFGKFLPFHKGHEAMIRFAVTQCDLLTVLVCASDQETTPAEIRRRWIVQTFDHLSSLEVRVFNYSESEFPNTSVASKHVAEIWSAKFRDLLPEVNLLVTSEPYGDYVASFMGIGHRAFDPHRKEFAISSTKIRGDLLSYWSYLPPATKRDFAIKVAVLGTESTGKTILTQRLAHHYGCSWVAEAGRDVVANSNSFHFADLETIAEEHARRIKEAVCGEHPLVILDTDIHITMSYARFSFARELPVGQEVLELNQASLYLYLTKDVPFVQDGTRLDEKSRNELDDSHRIVLHEKEIRFSEIIGGWDDRFRQAVRLIDQLISKKDIN